LLIPQVAARGAIDEGGGVSLPLGGRDGDGGGEREEREEQEEVAARHGRRRRLGIRDRIGSPGRWAKIWILVAGLRRVPLFLSLE
jgi:hypothetical protein